jgi:hypothetical protein
MNYQAAKYQGNEGRERWAVYSAASRTWYFPARYGRRAAERMAATLRANA